MTEETPASKGDAVPLRRSAKQRKALERRQAANDLREANDRAKANAAELAQIVNLHIAGYSFAEIAASVGTTADEIERRIADDAARYIRTQPALRTYVRNWVSKHYTQLLEAVWDDATNVNHKDKLESQDRAIKILDRMAKLHGAIAPVQTEVKVETAPEAVEAMVKILATAQGQGYDESVFDVIDAEVIHEAAAGKFLETPEADDGSEPL